MKYAFIFETETEVGLEFMVSSEVGEITQKIVGIKGPEQGEAVIKLLIDKFQIDDFEFCSAFTEEDMIKYRKTFGDEIAFAEAKYFPKEMEKLESAESLLYYGMIFLHSGIEKLQMEKLECEGCKGRIAFIRDIDEACEAAKKMVVEGIDFIELCGWFDNDKVEAVIRAIDGKVPVGSAGIRNKV